MLTRVRIGIEPLDAGGRPGPLANLSVHLEQVPRPHRPPRAATGAGTTPVGAVGASAAIGLPRMRESRSGRFSVVFGQPAFDDRPDLVVRLVTWDRRYVPRRLSVPAPRLQDVLDAEEAARLPPFTRVPSRARRPVLYPASAYGVGAGATAVQGRVTRPDGSPVRWARVVATTVNTVAVHQPDSTVVHVRPVLGHGHGDDRGDFVLFLGTLPAEHASHRSQDVEVRFRVSARLAPPVDSPTGSTDDPLWDLPVESLAASVGTDDPVARGTAEPPGFTAVVTHDITCRRGRVNASPVPFVLS